MPLTQAGLPFQGLSLLARQCSYVAAEAVAATRGTKTRWYVAYLFDRPAGAMDHQAARALHMPRSSICSIRNPLMTAGLVEARSRDTGRYGKPCTRWALTLAGRAAARTLCGREERAS